MTYVLSFYADGPKWENLVYLPAFPSGCSYFRPFRYRDEWLEDALLERLKADPVSLDEASILIAARFRSAQLEWSILPVRLATLRHFLYNEGEEHYFYFTLGNLCEFRDRKPLSQKLLSIPDDHQDRVGKAFFFETSLSMPPDAFVDRKSERASWAAFVDGLSDGTISVPEEVKNAVFFRIQWPTRGKRTLEPKVVERSQGEGPLFGFRLSEGARYEFEFAHRYPAFIRTHERMPPFRLELKTESTNFEINPNDEEVSGNYQTHFFRVAGKASSKTAEHIVLDPASERLVRDDHVEAPIPRLKIPVKVRWSPWFRARTSWVWLFVMLVGLFVSNLVAFTSNGGVARSDVFRLTLAASIAALAIFAAQQRAK